MLYIFDKPYNVLTKKECMQLYKITDEIQAIMDQIDPETGELGDELGRQLDQLEIDKGAKALALAKFMKSIDYEILAFKNEEKIMEAKVQRKTLL